MFERFTREARLAVIEAQEYARRYATPEIEATHLLLAMLGGGGDCAAGRLLAHVGVPPDAVAATVDAARRRGGLTDADTEALAELGIDVEQVVDRVERAHGEYALAGAGPCGPSGSRRHLPFAPAAKQVLERSLREAIELGDPHIGTEHLLLALTTCKGPAADVLTVHGADHVTLRRGLSGDSRRRGGGRPG